MARQCEGREPAEPQKARQWSRSTRAARRAFPKWAANRTFRGDGLTDAIDLICDFGSRSIAYAFIRNLTTSSVLSCLVPSLGGANETALQSRRRTG